MDPGTAPPRRLHQDAQVRLEGLSHRKVMLKKKETGGRQGGGQGVLRACMVRL